MKKKILIITLCTGHFLSTAQGNNHNFSQPLAVISSQSDEIDLRGRIEPGEIRRERTSISAFIEESDLKAQFNFDMGAVQITILNDIGNTVYSATILSSPGEILIPISNMSSGNYTIYFTAIRGTMSGEFTI
ncbi:DUF3244 domain-containing protein [Sphingobacterium sp.]|uniref:DUF3244 domain-containing protein n=1 Tax=Sphingobacterium sp. TaxID=341027 RepID=UPI0031DC2296